jgi:hypothetical protein
VAAVTQLPPEHVSPAPHDVGLPHWPQGSHVWIDVPEHWVEPGVHTGVEAHEQTPHEQPVVHVCVP